MPDYENILNRVLADPQYQRNILWGKPRPGHTEGTIQAHIQELERNLEHFKPKVSALDYHKLKLLIHVHDAFKPDANTGVSITDPTSHSSLARAYLAKFVDDPDLLAMVQWHDEPYALWRGFHSKGKVNAERFDALIHAIKDWDLFLIFNIIDASTEGKGAAHIPLRWFLREIQGKVKTKISEADLIV